MKTLITLLIVLFSTTLQAQYKFGWRGDSPGKVVRSLSSNQWEIKAPNVSSDLDGGFPDNLNQLTIGSCVAHGTLDAWNYSYHKATGGWLNLSRLQAYYEGRKAIGMTRVDSGCQIVDVVRFLQKSGAGKESLWPYRVERFTTRPPTKVYTDGKKRLVIKAFKVDNTDNISIRLALTNGYPVIVGSLVYGNINTLNSNNYVLKMPRRGERPIGGHCYLIIGHDDNKRLFKGRNSWGEDWGLDGDFYLPYDYIHSGRITEDCWVIIAVMF